MKLFKKKILVPIIIALIFIFYFSYVTFQSPLVGFSVKNDDGQWVVNTVYDNGWAYNQEIYPEDIIIQIDGVNPMENRQITKERVVRTAKSLSLLGSNGVRKDLSVTYESEILQLFSHLLLPFAYMLLTIYVAFYIYLKQKEDTSAFILIQFLLCIALAYGSAAASSRGDVVARLVNALTFAGCLILYIRFLSVFLKRFHITFIKQSNLWKLYSLLLLIMTVNIVVFFVPSLKSIQTISELSIFSFLLILICVLLIKNYSKYKNKPGNQAVKLLVLIFILAFSPFTFLYAIPAVLLPQYFIKAEIAVIFLLLIPISFIYLQLAEKLFDIDFIIGRLKYYTVLAFPFSLILCGIIGFTLRENTISTQITLIFIVLFVGSITFLYIKEWFDYKNRKYMFSTRGKLQTNLYTFFHKTRDENKVQVVIKRILNEIEDALMVQQAIFVEIEQQESSKDWRLQSITSEIFLEANEMEKIAWEHQTVGTILSFSKGFAIVIGSDIGKKKVILCDEKKSGTYLNMEEKIWLEMMAYFASVVVENMKLIEGLVEQIGELQLQETNEHPTWLSKLLFALSEKERANLSNDLHDTILQEQLQLLREVDALHKTVTDKGISDKLKDMRERMLDNVHLIRETCMELRPPLLNEQGLLESLYQLIRQTKLRCNFLLFISIDEKIRVVKDQELIFYRIIQELLHNAMKHSNAKEVYLDFHQNDQSIILLYEDDGVGFEISSDGHSFSSIGLVGMKERIRSVDGNIKVISSPGNGMKVRIEVGRGSESE